MEWFILADVTSASNSSVLASNSGEVGTEETCVVATGEASSVDDIPGVLLAHEAKLLDISSVGHLCEYELQAELLSDTDSWSGAGVGDIGLSCAHEVMDSIWPSLWTPFDAVLSCMVHMDPQAVACVE